MRICIDPGHGGGDPGGRSLGTPEKTLALMWSAALFAACRERGHEVILTRAVDDMVPLSERVRIANEWGADVFVSVHANASDNPKARGPWTIYAAPSTRGKQIATVVQRALARIMGGRSDAAYPDGSSWVDGRTLAVLRRTQMPAILLELGFMTNADDLAMLESPTVRDEAAGLIVAALETAMGVGGPAIPEPSGELATPGLVAEVIPPNLERIIVPTPEHIDEAVRVSSRWDAESVRDGLALAEVILRGMQRAGVKHNTTKLLADALSVWLNRKGGQ